MMIPEPSNGIATEQLSAVLQSALEIVPSNAESKPE
jgi:hypothetical protein